SNAMNASGALEALARADSAIGEIQAFLETSPESLMVLTSDSDAGGLQVMSHPRTVKPGQPLPAVSIGGGVLKGAGGVHGFPFVSAPDAAGVTRNFAIGYVGHADTAGGILVRAAGRGAERVTPLMDNTDVYKLMYWGLFGSEL
ncbi:MAG: alkaline phosphatase, partial [Pseudomonadota bacterium]